MSSNHKLLIWTTICVVAIILFVVGAIKGGEEKEKMRPASYLADRFQPYIKS